MHSSVHLEGRSGQKEHCGCCLAKTNLHDSREPYMDHMAWLAKNQWHQWHLPNKLASSVHEKNKTWVTAPARSSVFGFFLVSLAKDFGKYCGACLPVAARVEGVTPSV
eukprot:1139885-Pelagomonas_calceolata.AAC.2